MILEQQLFVIRASIEQSSIDCRLKCSCNRTHIIKPSDIKTEMKTPEPENEGPRLGKSVLEKK